MFFFFKQKTAYEMRISDWSSDGALPISGLDERLQVDIASGRATNQRADAFVEQHHQRPLAAAGGRMHELRVERRLAGTRGAGDQRAGDALNAATEQGIEFGDAADVKRSDEQTTELPSLMRISSAVFC